MNFQNHFFLCLLLIDEVILVEVGYVMMDGRSNADLSFEMAEGDAVTYKEVGRIDKALRFIMDLGSRRDINHQKCGGCFCI